MSAAHLARLPSHCVKKIIPVQGSGKHMQGTDVKKSFMEISTNQSGGSSAAAAPHLRISPGGIQPERTQAPKRQVSPGMER
jgi:hypothetical protein